MFGWVLDVSVICLEKPFTLCTKSRIHRVMVVERYFRRKLLWKSYILSKIMVEFNESHLKKTMQVKTKRHVTCTFSSQGGLFLGSGQMFLSSYT